MRRWRRWVLGCALALATGGCQPSANGDLPVQSDDDDSAGPVALCWPDADGDGFGSSALPPADCDLLPGGVPDGTDCDDTLSSVFPGALEVCDGLDSDCDGLLPLDESDDVDADGAVDCLDCDDANALMAPGLVEACDGLDNDCNGFVPAAETTDADGDGFAACDDCDDTEPASGPGLPELCDGLDNDCDGVLAIVEQDLDGDGGLACATDCDDSDPTVNVGLVELCDGLDNDCDGAVPAAEADSDGDGYPACADCDDALATVFPGAPATVCDGYDTDCDGTLEPIDTVDSDGDGYTPCDDCDDSSPTIFPGATWSCDGVDTDCDGSPDGDEVDDDGDGFDECGGDCNDASAFWAPGLPELCDGFDNDCDGLLPADELDADGDGALACADCDDTDPAWSWPTVEACDGLDNDCDGLLTGEGDLDNDGVLDCELFEWLAGWAGLNFGEITAAALPQDYWSAAADCATYSGSGTPTIQTPYALSPWPWIAGNATRTLSGPCTTSSGASLVGTLVTVDTDSGVACPSIGINYGPGGFAPTRLWGSEYTGVGISLTPTVGPALGWDGLIERANSCGGGTVSETVVSTSAGSTLTVDATVEPSQALPWLLGDGEHLLDLVHTVSTSFDNSNPSETLAVTANTRSGMAARTGGPEGTWSTNNYNGSFSCSSAPALCSTPPSFCGDEPMTGTATIQIRDAAGSVLQTQSVTFDGAVNCDGTGTWTVDGLVVGELNLSGLF